MIISLKKPSGGHLIRHGFKYYRRDTFPALGEGFKLNRSPRLQTEETPKPSLLQREKVANARIKLDFEFKVTKRLTDEVLR